MSYTALALAGVGLAVVLDLAVLRTRVLGRKAFWAAYAIMFGFQVLTNGVLTGRQVVVYDEAAILGVRFVHAPVEDLLFGFSLVLQTLAWWVWWGRRLSRSAGGGPPPVRPAGSRSAPRRRSQGRPARSGPGSTTR